MRAVVCAIATLSILAPTAAVGAPIIASVRARIAPVALA